MTFTAMEPNYSEWVPHSRSGVIARRCVDAVSSLRQGRGHQFLVRILLIVFVTILALAIVIGVAVGVSVWR
ncbi:MAG: hypothetical protein L6Q80_14845 [Dehalococcoidia bacterium]|nr:hypothetical protein [Dehalococcoidia bacterium]MCL4231902.1 hypothetical protein [Dehalococcoidia bacterium]